MKAFYKIINHFIRREVNLVKTIVLDDTETLQNSPFNKQNVGWTMSSFNMRSKVEKVPRGIRGEKSNKQMTSLRNLVSTIGAQASPTMGDGTRCLEG